MSTARFLSQVAGFKEIAPDDLEEIACNFETQHFLPGEHLIRRGASGDTMHVLREGHVRVPLVDANGNERSVFRLGPGELVGEMALLTGEPRTADVIAESPVTSLVIQRAPLQPLLTGHPRLAGFLTEILGRRLEEGGGIERVGKYRLLGKLGEGATGKVYEALHPGLNRAVAIKMLSHSLVYGPGFRERFIEEARTVAGLAHPNIVQVFDTETAYATCFLVMEKLAGVDLARVLAERGPLPADEASRLLGQVASALAYAHSRGFAHRDVKPANVFVCERGLVKLMDFGLARRIVHGAEGGRARSIDGTPQYLAPETALGRPTDGRVDIYALGVMAFELVTGRLPFEADSVQGLLQAHVRTPPPDVRALAPGLPEGLVEFIHGALVKKPDERLTDWDRIRRLIEPRRAATELWTRSEEKLLRIRYPPQAEARVEAAVQRLLAELGSIDEVELSGGKLERLEVGDNAAPGSGSPLPAREAGAGRGTG